MTCGSRPRENALAGSMADGRSLSPPPLSTVRGSGAISLDAPGSPRTKRSARASASSHNEDEDADTSGFAGWAAVRTAVKLAGSPPVSRVDPRASHLSLEPDSYAPVGGDGAWSDDEDADDEPVVSRKPRFRPWQRDIIKCSIAYLLASLFTFVPTLSDWLAAPFDSEGIPLGNAQSVAAQWNGAESPASSRRQRATFIPRARLAAWSRPTCR